MQNTISSRSFAKSSLYSTAQPEYIDKIEKIANNFRVSLTIAGVDMWLCHPPGFALAPDNLVRWAQKSAKCNLMSLAWQYTFHF